MQSNLPPFQRVELVPQTSPDGAGTNGNQITQPFETGGKGFSIVAKQTGAIPATTVVQVNNHNFLRHGTLGSTIHPVATFVTSTPAEVQARLQAAIDPDFDNYWVTLGTFSAGGGTGLGFFNNEGAFRYVRVYDGSSPLAADFKGFANISAK